jgi:hypothetical protein
VNVGSTASLLKLFWGGGGGCERSVALFGSSQRGSSLKMVVGDVRGTNRTGAACCEGGWRCPVSSAECVFGVPAC